MSEIDFAAEALALHQELGDVEWHATGCQGCRKDRAAIESALRSIAQRVQEDKDRALDECHDLLARANAVIDPDDEPALNLAIYQVSLGWSG